MADDPTQAVAMMPSATLRQLRKASYLSQSDLAARLGVSQPEVSRLERRLHEGKDMKLQNLKRYVEALGGKLVFRVWLRDEVFELVFAGLGKTT